jgi:hypothetical protein
MAQLFLKNTSTKWQSNLIDLNSALLLLSSLTMDQAKHWFAFVDDGTDVWVNILDCRLIVDQLIQAPVLAPEDEEMQIPKEFFNPEMHPEINVEEEARLMEIDETENGDPYILFEDQVVEQATDAVVAEEELKGAERRLNPRFDIKLRVIIKSGKNTYMTFTRDVSLGGLSLLTDVPDYIYNSEAEIYITAPDQRNNIMFICSPVASKLGKSRLMFTRIEASKQKILAAWLHHFVKPLAQKVS